MKDKIIVCMLGGQGVGKSSISQTVKNFSYNTTDIWDRDRLPKTYPENIASLSHDEQQDKKDAIYESLLISQAFFTDKPPYVKLINGFWAPRLMRPAFDKYLRNDLPYKVCAVYLTCPAEIQFQRVQQRNEERDSGIKEHYDAFLKEYNSRKQQDEQALALLRLKQIPVLTLDTSKPLFENFLEIMKHIHAENPNFRNLILLPTLSQFKAFIEGISPEEAEVKRELINDLRAFNTLTMLNPGGLDRKLRLEELADEEVNKRYQIFRTLSPAQLPLYGKKIRDACAPRRPIIWSIDLEDEERDEPYEVLLAQFLPSAEKRLKLS